MEFECLENGMEWRASRRSEKTVGQDAAEGECDRHGSAQMNTDRQVI